MKGVSIVMLTLVITVLVGKTMTKPGCKQSHGVSVSVVAGDTAAGPPGPKGPPGPRGPPGGQANWKECSWKNINGGKDNGKIKDCVFLKKNSNTALHVYWDGNLRIYNCNLCCKRWYFKFNGAECSGPMPIDGVVYMRTGKNKDLHRHRHIEGHCQNIRKGRVTVGFWVGNCHGYRNADAYTGWNSFSRIFIEEVPAPQK